MDPITAASVVQFLAPFTPYLIKAASTGGKKFIEAIAEKGGEATWNKAQDIWQRILSKFGKDKKLQGTINLLKTDPKDPTIQNLFYSILSEKLDKEPGFLKELLNGLGEDKIVQDVIAEGKSIILNAEQKAKGGGIKQTIKATKGGKIVGVTQTAEE